MAVALFGPIQLVYVVVRVEIQQETLQSWDYALLRNVDLSKAVDGFDPSRDSPELFVID